MAKCVSCGGEVSVVDANGRCPTCAATNPVTQPPPAANPVPQAPVGGGTPVANVPTEAPAAPAAEVPGGTPGGESTPPTPPPAA
ncbi:MAG TPA: hypothetical protein VMW04_00790 [Patescibacteria group bacterium]|nr:hypothetical protein [Patescibacteria group bacterium]